MEEDRQKLENMGHLDECTVNWSEEGGGLVFRVFDVFVLFEVPQFGGKPRYEETFTDVDSVLDIAYSWT